MTPSPANRRPNRAQKLLRIFDEEKSGLPLFPNQCECVLLKIATKKGASLMRAEERALKRGRGSGVMGGPWNRLIAPSRGPFPGPALRFVALC